jgi:hypothetical protein
VERKQLGSGPLATAVDPAGNLDSGRFHLFPSVMKPRANQLSPWLSGSRSPGQALRGWHA